MKSASKFFECVFTDTEKIVDLKKEKLKLFLQINARQLLDKEGKELQPTDPQDVYHHK